MTNNNTESKKVILGVLVGGVVGAGILCAVQAARHHKTPVIKKIGKTISEVGEMLENCNLNSSSDVISSIEKKIPQGIDVFNNAVDWISNGLTLWKKLKKG